ncbi:molybdopterin-containing oxidoreductase family protein [Zavarzinia sp. CC-PAN008]|uniref:molybdopterin-containing oxidoreductase family protein n=1 Tax=Zavarzinia sp. CC-PAN008 TaxID=3243332 RepID=UPI003F749528
MPRDGEIEIRRSVCPHDCPSQCVLEVERLDPRRIGRVRGLGANSYTAGVVCAKVARYSERQHHPARLTQPLLRTGPKGSGQFAPISWDEALDEVAHRFQAAERTHGAEAVWPYFFAGTMGLVQIYALNRLRHAMGYSEEKTTICSTVARVGYSAGTGTCRGVDPREMQQSDLIVMWGGNPVATQVNVMTHIAKARKGRGAKLVVIDPYRTGTAEVADMHLMLRPGTDAALACAVMHVCFRDGHADRDYLASHTDQPALLEAHLAARGPEWASAITGLSVAEIEDFAALYGRTKRSFLRLGYGFTRSRNGAVAMHAASCLAAVTGAWQYEGGGALFSNADLYALDERLLLGLDVRRRGIRALDQSQLGPILLGERWALGDGPPVTAMIVQNTNPAVVCPESAKVAQGFAREDLFLCVHEQFMTDTATYADIVLPATTFLEHDDIYKGGGHTFVHIGLKVVEPPGEARSNHDVVNALAQRLGGVHASFSMSERDLIEATLAASGLPGAQAIVDAGGYDKALPFATAHFLDGFATPDRKFRFSPPWAKLGGTGAGLPSLPDQWDVIDASRAEAPFRLVTAPARQFLNTSFTETPGSVMREKRPTVMVHPGDAAQAGIAEGTRVRLGNDRGSVVVHATLFDGVQPGVVVVETLWPNGAYEGGMGINTLTGADATPPAGGAPFHDTAVWLKAEPAAA